MPKHLDKYMCAYYSTKQGQCNAHTIKYYSFQI